MPGGGIATRQLVAGRDGPLQFVLAEPDRSGGLARATVTDGVLGPPTALATDQTDSRDVSTPAPTPAFLVRLDTGDRRYAPGPGLTHRRYARILIGDNNELTWGQRSRRRTWGGLRVTTPAARTRVQEVRMSASLTLPPTSLDL